MIGNIDIPIEYYGIDKYAKGEKIIVDEELESDGIEISEILRVYIEVANRFVIRGKSIIETDRTFIMSNLSIVVEFINKELKEELSILTREIPVYYSLNSLFEDSELNPKVSSMYVNNKTKGKIYIYSNIIPY